MSVPEVGKDAPKVLIIGVGGATNSGKTTLAKYLLSLFPAQRCLMLHQDDFALPESELPWNDTLQARDWDHPIGTIDYRRLELVLEHARLHGVLPEHHTSHDHLNEQPEISLDCMVARKWTDNLKVSLEKAQIDTVIIADGFLLYYDSRVRQHMDVRLFLRCDQETLEHRRDNRGGYATAEGTTWQDPPGYFEHVIWPGYLLAHERLFRDGNVNSGELIQTQKESFQDGGPVPGLILLDTEQLDMDTIVDKACHAIIAKIAAAT